MGHFWDSVYSKCMACWCCRYIQKAWSWACMKMLVVARVLDSRVLSIITSLTHKHWPTGASICWSSTDATRTSRITTSVRDDYTCLCLRFILDSRSWKTNTSIAMIIILYIVYSQQVQHTVMKNRKKEKRANTQQTYNNDVRNLHAEAPKCRGRTWQ